MVDKIRVRAVWIDDNARIAMVDYHGMGAIWVDDDAVLGSGS
jgi:hypothetical protein